MRLSTFVIVLSLASGCLLFDGATTNNDDKNNATNNATNNGTTTNNVTTNLCNNGIRDEGEECDGALFGGEKCETVLADSTGELVCSDTSRSVTDTLAA